MAEAQSCGEKAGVPAARPRPLAPTPPRSSALPQVTSTSRVLLKLFLHTIAMFTLPFIAYYSSKGYVEREYGLEPPKSLIYGAITAVIVVQGVIFSYVYQAFQEEQLAKRVAAASKRD